VQKEGDKALGVVFSREFVCVHHVYSFGLAVFEGVAAQAGCGFQVYVVPLDAVGGRRGAVARGGDKDYAGGRFGGWREGGGF
jgi:hypothetical protein